MPYGSRHALTSSKSGRSLFRRLRSARFSFAFPKTIELCWSFVDSEKIPAYVDGVLETRRLDRHFQAAPADSVGRNGEPGIVDAGCPGLGYGIPQTMQQVRNLCHFDFTYGATYQHTPACAFIGLYVVNFKCNLTTELLMQI